MGIRFSSYDFDVHRRQLDELVAYVITVNSDAPNEVVRNQARNFRNKFTQLTRIDTWLKFQFHNNSEF